MAPISDEDDFDATEAALAKLRSTPTGAVALDKIATAARDAAVSVLDAAGPVVLEVGRMALPVLESFAVSMLQAELGKILPGH